VRDELLRRYALGSVLLGFRGDRVPDWLAAALRDGLGGVVLFGSNMPVPDRLSELTAELRALAGRDIVIATDEEGGDVTRLETTTGSSSPGAAALGHLDDPTVTEEVYAATGARLASAGVTVDLAPCADVNSDPRNPVIGVRSFGADPQRAARHVAAAVRGLQRSGVAACIKHFPGHGATTADSHHAVPTITASRQELDSRELVPFRAGIAAGTRAVMTGHLVVPALDQAIATVSSAITSSLLRDELRFGGVVVTDALEMRALTSQVTLAEGVVRALAAGADAIETGALDYPELVEQVPDAVERAVADGTLTPGRVAAAAAATASLAVPGTPAQYDGDLVQAAAGRCVELLGPAPGVVAPVVVECRTRNGEATGELDWSFARALSEFEEPGRLEVVTDEPQADAALSRLGGTGPIVLVVRDPQRFPWQRPLIDHAERRPGSVVVDVGWPEPADRLVAAGVSVVRTRGIAPGLLTAAARIVAGTAGKVRG
jgi:beta-N-acetylhexosaminidase